MSTVDSRERGIGRVHALDDDLVGAQADHQQGHAQEQVGGDGEDVAGLAQAAQVGRG